jgi:hypothetical protein
MMGTFFGFAVADLVGLPRPPSVSQALLFQHVRLRAESTGDRSFDEIEVGVDGELFVNIPVVGDMSMASASLLPCVSSSSLGDCRSRKSAV